jgi:hypothetical protein
MNYVSILPFEMVDTIKGQICLNEKSVCQENTIIFGSVQNLLKHR